ncbi:MAG TPA: hypothetical protein VHY35_03075 [Stellaceae bacterium]|jgi:hypothetical protein|nr:hypothetical protein [Stellaceae bacterium]
MARQIGLPVPSRPLESTVTFAGTIFVSDLLIEKHYDQKEAIMAGGILLWLLGIPLPIILILALLWH